MNLTENTWIGILSLLSALFGGIGTRWYENYKKKQKHKAAEKHANRLHNTFIVFDTIEKLIEHEGIERVLLLIGSNGGSEPRPGHLYQIQAIHGASTKTKMDDLVNDYKQVRADAHYIDMLRNLLVSKDSVKYDVSKMPDGKLKTYYESEGVKYSNIYYLGNSKEELYFCSISSYNKPLTGPSIEKTINIAIDTMRNVFELYAIKD